MNTTRICALLIALCSAVSAHAETDAPGGGIYNFREVDTWLSTSGQPDDEAIPRLAAGGYGLIVNLAIADAERNANEGFLVAQEGLSYTQIPVDWMAPTLADLDLFFAVMDARGERRALVHCFANFRASAFTYLYQTIRLGVPESEARADLEAIWTEEAWAEYPHWADFIERAQAHHEVL